MTDIYSLTEQLENAVFLGSDGYPVSTGPATTQTPFYVDASGHLNFGFGIDISEDPTDAIAALSASAGGKRRSTAF